MGAVENRKLMEKWYTALSQGDFRAMIELHPDDVVFNLIGNTPVSGRYVGKKLVFQTVLAEKVVAALKPESVKFGKRWRIMAADDNCVVGLMQGGGIGKNGEAYDQTYCQIFTIRDGLIAEIHEFFDTVLVEKALFSNNLERPEAAPENPFSF